MKSRRSKRFRASLEALPPDIQRLATDTYQRWQQNPSHPGLHFKPIDSSDPDIYSIRIGAHYRAICERQPDGAYLWVWIGTHEEYDKLI
jgi:mRNA-degrading endonuclease RelE of RelBE toxin-antitoxin system